MYSHSFVAGTSFKRFVEQNSTVIHRYVLQDPDYGIEYLVNDRGGCYPRLDPYGNVIGVSYE